MVSKLIIKLLVKTFINFEAFINDWLVTVIVDWKNLASVFLQLIEIFIIYKR